MGVWVIRISTLQLDDSSPIQVYRGRPDEHTALLELASQWETSGSFWPAEMVLESVARAHVSLVYYKDHDDHWSGMILYQLIEDHGELLYVYVSKENRKTGIGLSLFEIMIQDIKAGLRPVTLSLEVRPSNTAAIHLYKKYGMNQSSIREKYYDNGEDALIFQGTF